MRNWLGYLGASALYHDFNICLSGRFDFPLFPFFILKSKKKIFMLEFEAESIKTISPTVNLRHIGM